MMHEVKYKCVLMKRASLKHVSLPLDKQCPWPPPHPLPPIAGIRHATARARFWGEWKGGGGVGLSFTEQI